MPSVPTNLPTGDFLALPEPHHHVSRLIVLVIMLAVIILVVWLYSLLILPKWTSLPVPSETISTVQTKEQPITVTLTPKQAQQKTLEITSVNSARVKLTAAQIKEKSNQIKQALLSQ